MSRIFNKAKQMFYAPGRTKINIKAINDLEAFVSGEKKKKDGKESEKKDPEKKESEKKEPEKKESDGKDDKDKKD